jgi:hypothetical protein
MCSRAFFFGSFVHFLYRQDRMSVGTSCSHFSGNPDRFHQLLSGSSVTQRRLGVAFYAVRALSHVRHRDVYQLFHSDRQRPFGEYLLAEMPGRPLQSQAPILGASVRFLVWSTDTSRPT